MKSYESAASDVASNFTYGGAGVSLFAWLVNADWAMLTGVLVGLVGLSVNIYYKRKENQRAEQEAQRADREEKRAKALHDLQMQKLREDCDGQ
ncbi:MAG: holin [Neisseria sp.]|nr:holin [Neisseria sp.]